MGPGVYMFSRFDVFPNNIERVLYVGMSKNLFNRSRCHPMVDVIAEKFKYFSFLFMRWPEWDLRRKEKELIELLDPPYNIIHRRRGCAE